VKLLVIRLSCQKTTAKSLANTTNGFEGLTYFLVIFFAAGFFAAGLAATFLVAVFAVVVLALVVAVLVVFLTAGF
jgi:hypothetical protein